MLVKQPIQIPFVQGLDTKTDDKQVSIGRFLSLENSIFQKGGLLQKRNGYGSLPALPNDESVYLTTLNGNMTALGSAVQAYSSSNSSWISKGTFQPISISTLPMSRSSINEVQCDCAISESGLACTIYTQDNNSTISYNYVIADVNSGQNIIPNTMIPGLSAGGIAGGPRVFVLGPYFIIIFTVEIGPSVYHLQYFAITISNPTIVSAITDLVASYSQATLLSWDGVTVGDNLYIAYSTTGAAAVDILYITIGLVISSPVTFTGSFSGQLLSAMTVCADITNLSHPIIYASFYAGSNGYSLAVDTALTPVMTPTTVITGVTVTNIVSAAQNGIVTIVYEIPNQYSYDSAIVTNYLQTVSVALPATPTTGTVGATTLVLRSVGLASKAFIINEIVYILTEYASLLQSTYFLTDTFGNIISRFAYGNGGAALTTGTGYLSSGLPQAQIYGAYVYIAYLFKDLIESRNAAGLTPSIGRAGSSNIYSQTGVNLVKIGFDSNDLIASEIGANLNISGGLLWTYDGQTLSEQGFNVFPDSVEVSSSATSGGMTAQQYYYQVVYEWTDAAGNIIQSAPSIPVTVTLTSDTSVEVDIPTLRLSYKADVKIVVYRWSTANQVYYQVTSILAPTLNDPTTDSISYIDILADSSIIGNSIIYTNGGVIEDIAGPAAVATTLFDDRLWLIDAEDQNLLWYSKQVIEATPVEMSDLLTIYIAPSTGAQGTTGPITGIFPMDDKLIVFKKDAIYYINGSGPDNTGANSQYSQPVFISSTVGCSNQRSIVIVPTINGSPGGLMFQSDKGIWLLGRDLSTSYIGAAVEEFNSYSVNSATAVPGTNQVRFTLSDGTTLMYDYYYQQWGTFTGVPAVSSAIYQGLHSYISPSGSVAQETPGIYIDGTNPVLMSFLTGWIQLQGISGYERIWEIQLLGQYYSPHLLNVQLGYDFYSLSESATITPTNQSFGGSLEQWRIQPSNQKCQAFQFSLQEVYDPSFDISAGAGFTLSAMTMVLGVTRGYRPVKAVNTTGTTN